MSLLMNAADVRGLIRSLCDADRCPKDSREFWTIGHLRNLAEWAEEKEAQERMELSCFVEAAMGDPASVGAGMSRPGNAILAV